MMRMNKNKVDFHSAPQGSREEKESEYDFECLMKMTMNKNRVDYCLS